MEDEKKIRRRKIIFWCLAAVAMVMTVAVPALFRPAQGVLETYTLTFQEREIEGRYEGGLRRGLPEGEGVFVSGKGDFVYRGGFHRGQMSGKGRLKDTHFVQTFPADLVDRVGTYEGEMLDGEASGQATFRTQNKAYDWYTFTGTYAHNRWNGYGKLQYDDPFYFVREGNWVDCEFLPTVEEFYRAYGTWQGMAFELTEETAAFLREKGEDLLADPEKYAKNAVTVTWEELGDHIGETVVLDGLTILENERNDRLWGRDFMNICAEDEAGHRVHLLALQAYPVGWNYRIRGTVIPLAASVYPNEHAVQTDTFVCAVVNLEWEKP